MESENTNMTCSKKLTIADLVQSDKSNYSYEKIKYTIPKNQREYTEKRKVKP